MIRVYATRRPARSEHFVIIGDRGAGDLYAIGFSHSWPLAAKAVKRYTVPGLSVSYKELREVELYC